MKRTLDGVALIANERQRQINEKGYTDEHDDSHDDGQLLRVAGEIVSYVDPSVSMDLADPWGIVKRTERKFPDAKAADVRLLVIAGALIAAEIDRLQRAATPQEDRHDG